MIEANGRTSLREFFDSYTSDAAATGFTAFLFERSVERPDEPDFSNANSASLAIFAAIQLRDKSTFNEVYEEMSRRQPRNDAPWLFNDPLIYGLVLGAVLFECDTSWVLNVLRFRMEHSKGDTHEIASTFIDVLSRNWWNEANIRPLMLVSRRLLGLPTVERTLLDGVYQTVTSPHVPFHESNFLNAVFIRAFDVVVLSKEPLDSRRALAIERIIKAAWKRSLISGWLVWWGGLIFLLGVGSKLLLWAAGLGDEAAKDWIQILSQLGIPIFAFIPIWPWVAKRARIVKVVQLWVAERDFGLDTELLTPPDN